MRTHRAEHHTAHRVGTRTRGANFRQEWSESDAPVFDRRHGDRNTVDTPHRGIINSFSLVVGSCYIMGSIGIGMPGNMRFHQSRAIPIIWSITVVHLPSSRTCNTDRLIGHEIEGTLRHTARITEDNFLGAMNFSPWQPSANPRVAPRGRARQPYTSYSAHWLPKHADELSEFRRTVGFGTIPKLGFVCPETSAEPSAALTRAASPVRRIPPPRLGMHDREHDAQLVSWSPDPDGRPVADW